MISRTPLFTIGVPTYNRIELLKQTIKSIVNQTFTDFEIIIGNDFIDEPLTFDQLGFYDDRIQIINNKTNLGEGDNMNNLLHQATGKYFTWQFDDDIYDPSFLKTVSSVLEENENLQCIYSSIGYIYGENYPSFAVNKNIPDVEVMPVVNFIPQALTGRIKVAGCCGVFNRISIMEIGGIEKLCNTPIAIHSEFLLLIHLYRFHKVGFIPHTLMYSRDYEGTFSGSTTDYESYRIAGLNLFNKGLSIHFKHCNDLEGTNKFINGILTTILKFYIMRVSSVRGIDLDSKIKVFTEELLIELGKFENLISYDQILDIEENFLNKKWTETKIKALLKWKTPKFLNRIIKICRARTSGIAVR